MLADLGGVLVSLHLTVVLIIFSIALVLAATLDQVNLGIWAIQEKYIRSFLVYWEFGDRRLPIFPGGYLLGGLLLANLIAAHVWRFKFVWRKAGILLVHAGLIVLIVGELATGLWQEEFQMRLDEGQTRNYSESYHLDELAIIDITDAGVEHVVAVPAELLASQRSVQHPKLPFRVETRRFFANSTVELHGPRSHGAGNLATTGVGPRLTAREEPNATAPDSRNAPTAFVELVAPEGSLGTWMVSLHLAEPQRVEYGGRTWLLSLRPERRYKPFALTLLKFSHDRYPGTEIPKNFSSRLRLFTADGREDREVLIYMNNPLRYDGLTFYQAGFANDDRTTVLQVVRNPGWLLPYLASSMMGLGLVVQFSLQLLPGRRRSSLQSATRT